MILLSKQQGFPRADTIYLSVIRSRAGGGSVAGPVEERSSDTIVAKCVRAVWNPCAQKRERGTAFGSPSQVFVVSAVAASAGRCQRCAPQERCDLST